MKMDDMNMIFESRGFEVKREWEHDNKRYRFTISKDGHCRTETFIYPCGADRSRASKLQRDFVDGMIKRFYKELRNDGLAVYAYAYELMEGYKEAVKQEEWIRSLVNSIEIIPIADQRLKPRIKNVIFNDPATIVFWTDGTKTVVKAQDRDEFDPEKGLAMAISKKALGNKGNYCNVLKKWLPKEEEKEVPKFDIKLPDTTSLAEAAENMRKLMNALSADRKESAVQRAYDILVEFRDKGKCMDVDTVIGLLGEALEG